MTEIDLLNKLRSHGKFDKGRTNLNSAALLVYLAADFRALVVVLTNWATRST